MQEKKFNELSEEALDAVTGGATYAQDPDSGYWIVRDSDGNEVRTFKQSMSAKRYAEVLSQQELQHTTTETYSVVGFGPKR